MAVVRASHRGTLTRSTAYSWSQLLHPDAGMRAAARRWYERAIDFTAALGATATGGYVGAFSVRDAGDPGRRDDLLRDLGRSLQDLTLYAARCGLQGLLVENMAASREWGAHDQARLERGARERRVLAGCSQPGRRHGERLQHIATREVYHTH